MNQAPSKAPALWWIAVVAFTIISLWPIWSTRFPAMQDYPQHLLQAKIFAGRNDPQLDYQRYFEFHLRPVYATFFAATVLFAKLLPLEIAGKLALSLYIALIATLVIKLGRRLGNDVPPWGLLLLFPFAFNQQYFQGNINYCYSLPLILLALLDQEDLIRQPLTPWAIYRHLLWQVALFITHLYAFGVFVGFAAISAVCYRSDRARLQRAAVPLAVAGVLLAMWFIDGGETVLSTALSGGNSRLLIWMPWSESLGFLFYMFTGMRWHDGVDLTTTFLWVLLGAVLAWASVRTQSGSGAPKERGRLWLICLALCLVGTLASPFQMGEYTFLNFRLASLSYFFLAAFAGAVRLTGVPAAASAALTAVLLVGSVEKQRRVSNEIQEILPVIEAMAPNANVLPLVFDRSSPELDPTYFDMHLHTADYYHILKGGGLGPYFLKASIHPVHLKPGVELPNPGEYQPASFNWDKDGMAYDYFLTRGMPADFAMYMTERAELQSESGPWQLYARKHVPDAITK